jgi:hypothetical protein
MPYIIKTIKIVVEVIHVSYELVSTLHYGNLLIDHFHVTEHISNLLAPAMSIVEKFF